MKEIAVKCQDVDLLKERQNDAILEGCGYGGV